MMNTAVHPQTDSNGQPIVTPNERQALLQKLASRCSQEMSTRIEKQAFEKSQGIKPQYLKIVHTCLQQLQASMQNRANQQQQQQQQQLQQLQQLQQQQQQQQQQHSINSNIRFLNAPTNIPPQAAVINANHVQHPINQMPNQTPRFPVAQQSSLMNNLQPTVLNSTARVRELPKFNPTSINPLSYSQSLVSTSTITTAVDLSQDCSSQQNNGTNQYDYSLIQPRYPASASANAPRQRIPIPNNNFQQQSSSNKPNDISNQVFVGGSPSRPMLLSSSSPTTTLTTVNTNSSSTGDQLLQRILLSNTDGSRPAISTNMLPTARIASTMISNLNNSTTSLRPSLSTQKLSPSPALAIMPTPTQASTVPIQPLNNMTIQQSPLNNNNGPLSSNSQTVSTNSSTATYTNYSSPTNRVLPLSGSGIIASPDNEIAQLIKYLRENVNRLQLLCQKFTNDGNTEKLRQVQLAYQQIMQFINNPTYETLPNAKRLRDVLEQITNRLQQASNLSISAIPATSSTLPTTTTAAAAAIGTTATATTTTTTTTTAIATTTTVAAPATTNSQTNVFNQCLKATKEFLSRDQKDRINITKRYLEPLSDVINGVPHKVMRLDGDNPSTIKIRSRNQLSLLSNLNDEINQLPDDIYSIERVSVACTRKHSNDDDDDDDNDEYLSKNGIILRCKLLEKPNPLIPTLRLHVTTFYPEQPPEVLSLTKTMPPKLEFADGHPFFDQMSSIFVSRLFKLNAKHTVTDILNVWRQSVQAAM
ncbi:unnamed protein product [Rotaria magnacalcarata]|uniref:ARC105/Med15 mediator subunit C-terminal domain-containing protein n=1 Tax=Rotaria magnacalcarata TaxID=392030 RepID=A0A816MCJ2_9BILA|nr:unnamed protein product [Rotaria magnacalcarata]CAF2036460.1 unnamed protein product [Rotaria magnacalcarata]